MPASTSVVNYGEGIVQEWRHEVLAQIFHEDAGLVGRILLDALADLPDGGRLPLPGAAQADAARSSRHSCGERRLRRATSLELPSAQASTESALNSACRVMLVHRDPVRL